MSLPRQCLAPLAALALWPVEGWACAPSPVLAAERYARAVAACDFVGAWPLLAPGALPPRSRVS
jgi:hypothetical protein